MPKLVPNRVPSVQTSFSAATGIDRVGWKKKSALEFRKNPAAYEELKYHIMFGNDGEKITAGTDPGQNPALAALGIANIDLKVASGQSAKAVADAIDEALKHDKLDGYTTYQALLPPKLLVEKLPQSSRNVLSGVIAGAIFEIYETLFNEIFPESLDSNAAIDKVGAGEAKTVEQLEAGVKPFKRKQ